MTQPLGRSSTMASPTVDPVSRIFRAGARSMHMGFRPRTQVDAMPMPSSSSPSLLLSPTDTTTTTKPLPAPQTTNPAQDFKNIADMLATMQSRASGFLRSVAQRMTSPYLSSLLQDQPLFGADATTTARTTTADAQSSFFFNFAPYFTPRDPPSSTATSSTAPSTTTTAAAAATEPLLNRFLSRADRLELLYACLLSDLSNMAYEADKVQDAELQRHNLTLVATSASPVQGPLTHQDTTALLTSKPPSTATPPLAPPMQTPAPPQPKPAAAHLSPSKPRSSGCSSSKRRPRLSSMTTCPSPSRLDSPGPPSAPCPDFPLPTSTPHLPPPAAPTALPAQGNTPTSTPTPDNADAAATKPPPSAAPPPPPAAWFSADDPVSNTRFLVIQGSISLEHWAINFRFDPVVFEDPALGVRVHRGVYEAALHLYDDLLPLVRQHLASSPSALVSLGGHSLGGSIAAVVMLLLVGRGGVRPEQLAPSYSFGAPAVFCAHGAGLGAAAVGGAGAAAVAALQRDAPDVLCNAGNPGCLLPSLTTPPQGRAGNAIATGAAPDPSAGLRRSLMAHLRIPEQLLTNVIMHKDIVPRAFICDYSVVAEFLKNFMPSFKDHWTLSAAHQHKYLYTYIGRVAVLKPDNDAPFVLDDNEHPMLPDEAGLYKLQDPRHDAPAPAARAPGKPGRPAARRPAPAAAPAPSSPGAAAAPSSLASALLQFMNYPHPLQSLSKLCSYGSEGAISRYHNPNNYTRGLLRLLD